MHHGLTHHGATESTAPPQEQTLHKEPDTGRRALCIWFPQWPLQRWLHAEGRLTSHESLHRQESLHPEESRDERSKSHIPPSLAGRGQGEGRSVESQNRDGSTGSHDKSETKPPSRSPLPRQGGGLQVLIYRRQGRRGSVVVEGSPSLIERGVRPDMPLAEARALATRGERSRQKLVIREHDPLADRIQLEHLAEWCHQFSPTVALADEGGDAIWLDVTSVGHLAGGEQKLVARVAQAFAARGWRVQLAASDSFAAAYALARFRATEGQPLWAPPGETRALAMTLPIESLQLSPQAADTLDSLGIRQVRELERLPRAGVGARLGGETMRELDRLFGQQAEAMNGVRPSEHWEECFEFETPVSQDATLIEVLARLCRRLSARLAAAQQGATALTISLTLPPEPEWRRELRLFRPSAEPKHWIELATLQLEQARLGSPVSKLTLSATATGRLEVRQQELFASSEPSGEAKRELATLVNRLVGRLGHQHVLTSTLAADPLPESSYRTTSAVATSRARREPPVPWRPLERPLELLPATRQSLRLTTDEAGAPTVFHWRGEEYRIARSWGPERIESGWWRGHLRRRDYYRVETDEGRRAWVYNRRDDDRWFLHGWFA
jgi:protein ImuB